MVSSSGVSRMARAPREETYNVVVIGAGTAGLVTAAGTAALGGRVALVERNRMGGDCVARKAADRYQRSRITSTARKVFSWLYRVRREARS
jgi:glycine/D-amino acid oxidase-like deaminating enzyme